jgi:hypothetical protein
VLSQTQVGLARAVMGWHENASFYKKKTGRMRTFLGSRAPVFGLMHAPIWLEKIKNCTPHIFYFYRFAQKCLLLGEKGRTHFWARALPCNLRFG